MGISEWVIFTVGVHAPMSQPGEIVVVVMVWIVWRAGAERIQDDGAYLGHDSVIRQHFGDLPPRCARMAIDAAALHFRLSHNYGRISPDFRRLSTKPLTDTVRGIDR